MRRKTWENSNNWVKWWNSIRHPLIIKQETKEVRPTLFLSIQQQMKRRRRTTTDRENERKTRRRRRRNSFHCQSITSDFERIVQAVNLSFFLLVCFSYLCANESHFFFSRSLRFHWIVVVKSIRKQLDNGSLPFLSSLSKTCRSLLFFSFSFRVLYLTLQFNFPGSMFIRNILFSQQTRTQQNIWSIDPKGE